MIKFLISFTTRFIPRHYLQLFAAFALRTLGFFYLGNRFEDPISGKKYRKLLPYGRTNVRENALAPHSMSLERHRLIWLYLKEKTNFFTAPQKVLHIAPEYCFLKLFKKQSNLDYVTADLISPWADVKMDVQAIPSPIHSLMLLFVTTYLSMWTPTIKRCRRYIGYLNRVVLQFFRFQWIYRWRKPWKILRLILLNYVKSTTNNAIIFAFTEKIMAIDYEMLDLMWMRMIM